jgi:hypothetical protein
VSWQLELRELATFLGRADPWYQNTVNTLCPAIHKLAEMVGAASVRGGEGQRSMESEHGDGEGEQKSPEGMEGGLGSRGGFF